MIRRIAVFTGGRADWGLISMPARALAARGADVAIVATGQHAGATGTHGLIAADGFDDIALIDMGLADDSGAALVRSVGRLHGGLADAFERLRPDLLLILGDRYEALAGASAATLMQLPIAHIAGGDVTEGAIDDAMRHAISKLSHLHFVTNAEARMRLRAMGEADDRIVVAGSPGIDRLMSEEAMARETFFAEVGLKPRARNALVTFHPVTLSRDGVAELRQLLAALAGFGDLGLIFTGVNADPGFRAYDDEIQVFCAGRANAVHHAALGSRRYTNALRHCDVVIGNSSSGLYEAPSFRTPTVNIGDRQKGRIKAASVLDCPSERESIRRAIMRAFAGDWSGVTNPYGDGHASGIIAETILAIPDSQALLRKTFVERTVP